jgi:hypothetical protein
MGTAVRMPGMVGEGLLRPAAATMSLTGILASPPAVEGEIEALPVAAALENVQV